VRQFYVYILSSRSGVLYVGVTNDLERRVYQHKHRLVEGFTSRYNVNLLVFYEVFPEAIQAIAAEKKIKGWTRAKKVRLIESKNPTWKDLSEGWEEGQYVPPAEAGPATRPPGAAPGPGDSAPSRQRDPASS
jgi:putative endonuclease